MNRKLILALCTIFTTSTLISTYSVNTYADTPSTYETTETITPEDASSTGTIPSIENIPAFSVSNEKSLILSHAYIILF